MKRQRLAVGTTRATKLGCKCSIDPGTGETWYHVQCGVHRLMEAKLTFAKADFAPDLAAILERLGMVAI